MKTNATVRTMVSPNRPEYAGEYGSVVPVNAKQRPQGSPGSRLGADPNESWETAVLYPEAEVPHAEGKIG